LGKVNLRIGDGQIMGIIGPNGAGKATLFNVATSIYKPDSGDIYPEDRGITRRLHIAFAILGVEDPAQRSISQKICPFHGG
jgi:ABC-type branched-subunit amino acid transport system ATPase component